MWGIFNIVCGVLYVIWYNWQMYTGACDKKFRHPATAPAGVFSDEEVVNADTGIFARLYFHSSPSVNKASAIEGDVKC